MVIVHDATDRDQTNPRTAPITIPTEGRGFRFVRLTATKLAERKDDYILALAEIEVIAAADAVNLAKAATVTSKDSIESGERWRRQVDWVCVVDCQTETQIQRVMARSALTRPEIEGIMAQQATRAQRLASADVVIYNEGIDLVQLKHLAHEMMARFGL